jgi:hypothetical protein
MSRRPPAAVALLPVSPLLITESAEEFDRISEAFNQEIKARGIIEHMFVADITYLFWDILRLRRCKSSIINTAFRGAMANLLQQLLREPGTFEDSAEEEADNLCLEWFTDREAKKRVSALLGKFQLDETAIEAEAFRRSVTDLEQIDRLLASLESRRNKALRCIAEYRTDFARQLRNGTDRIIEGKVLPLERASSKKPSAAA